MTSATTWQRIERQNLRRRDRQLPKLERQPHSVGGRQDDRFRDLDRAERPRRRQGRGHGLQDTWVSPGLALMSASCSTMISRTGTGSGTGRTPAASMLDAVAGNATDAITGRCGDSPASAAALRSYT